MKILGKTSRNHVEIQFKISENPLAVISEKSCIDHVFTIRLFLEKAEIKLKKYHSLQKAYDSARRL